MSRSVFETENQNNRVESRIVAALERISEAFRVLLWSESKEHGLSPIQMQILIFILFHSDEKCKVSYLAEEFNLTKATISDSVRTLVAKKHVQRIQDTHDSRSHTIALTPRGRQLAKEVSLFANVMERPLDKFNRDQKEVMLQGLMNLIYDLNKADIITIQRMCRTCTFYRTPEKGRHYCNLLEKELKTSELRLDCPEHSAL